jgi:hypothetical protein
MNMRMNCLQSVNHLKPVLVLIIFKYSVLTSKKTQPITVTKIMEIIAVYSENHMKPINTLHRQNVELLIVKAKQVVHIVNTRL